MSEFIFAIIGIMVGGAVGVLVMSMLTVSKRVDEEATHSLEVFLEGIRHSSKALNKLTVMTCPYCRRVYTLSMYIENRCCPYCGSIGGGEGI